MKLYVWRHPKPINAQGVCLGQTNLGVDNRLAKRLANRIQKYATKHNLIKEIWVSPLKRSYQVGKILEQRGFICHIYPKLMEIDFGDWDGQLWSSIPKAHIDAWCEDFALYAPNGGESLVQFFKRVDDCLKTFNNHTNKLNKSGKFNSIDSCKPNLSLNSDLKDNEKFSNKSILIIGHAGWINAAKLIASGKGAPQLASKWPLPPAYNKLSLINFE